MEAVIKAVMEAVARLNPRHPEVAVWLPEATYIAEGADLDEVDFGKHYADWYSRIVLLAQAPVSVGWTVATRIDENGVSQVAECFISLNPEPTRILGVRK